MATDPLFDILKNLLAAANPGLVTRADLNGLDERLDELDALVDDLEAALNRQADDTRRPPGP